MSFMTSVWYNNYKKKEEDMNILFEIIRLLPFILSAVLVVTLGYVLYAKKSNSKRLIAFAFIIALLLPVAMAISSRLLTFG